MLDSLSSPESKRGYQHAIDEFIQWYCSEPRLSFNKTVVTRYRIALENRQLAAGTINGRLAAVRRLAYEATERVVWHVVKQYALKLALPHVAPHDLRRSCAKLCHGSGGELEQIQFLLGGV